MFGLDDLKKKLDELQKKNEPLGGLAIMMSTRDYAALAILASSVTELSVDECFDYADAFVEVKKKRT